jgi:alginate O-acetyltransferase complex protein AlgI
MIFTSLNFILFLSVCLIVYYILPLKARWILLLAGSIFFYVCSGWEMLIFVIATALVSYGAALRMDWIYSTDKYAELNQAEKKKKAKVWLYGGLILVIGVLAYTKLAHYFVKADNIIIPLGISYYTFGIVGYMADVYWKRDKAEKNPLKLLLYMIYFPHILQGPIARHKKLAGQLSEGHSFQYRDICFGLQRVLWGFFKKLVIADRFAVLVNEIFNNYEQYEGQYFIIAIFSCAVQLYCDFSGCMDIAIGVSECFGIHLEENFKRPFYSKSAAEFWRRWHITLGAWFKDYVYMPMVINPRLIKLSKKAKDRFGPRFGKSLMTVIPLAIVWLFTGLWHGTGIDYIIWGCYWGLIIIISAVFAPEFKKLNKWLKINTESGLWKGFQMLRTCLIFCGGRLLTAPGDIRVSMEIIRSIFTKGNMWIWFDQSLYNLGLSRQELWVGIWSLLLLVFISHKQEQGVKIREKVASLPLPIRWILYYGLFFLVLILGRYGSGFEESAFVYMQY